MTINTETKFVKCEHCAMSPVCEPVVSGNSILTLSQSYLTKRSPICSGETAFNKNAPLKDIYAVCAGVFKLCDYNDKGEEKIVGFRFPGELLGDDALYPEKYSYNAIAVGNAAMCKVTVSDLINNSTAVPKLQLNLVNLLTRQSYVNHQGIDAIVAKKTAESLLVAFLLNIAERTKRYSESRIEFELPLSRDDMANFLGLRRETLSRILTKLQKSEFIEIQSKKIKLLDLERLNQIANQ